jgi:hypothetical protein
MASAEGARSEAASASEPAEVGGADRAEPSEAVVRASLRLAARTHKSEEGPFGSLFSLDCVPWPLGSWRG